MTTKAFGSRQALHWRLLSPEREDAIRQQRAAGARAAELARVYGVGLRTIYRTLHRTRAERLEVTFGDYVATFEMTSEGPAQVGPWTPR